MQCLIPLVFRTECFFCIISDVYLLIGPKMIVLLILLLTDADSDVSINSIDCGLQKVQFLLYL